jgi:glutathione synthase/RimK-type ligase-like ATP-grasp enzyme
MAINVGNFQERLIDAKVLFRKRAVLQFNHVVAGGQRVGAHAAEGLGRISERIGMAPGRLAGKGGAGGAAGAVDGAAVPRKDVVLLSRAKMYDVEPAWEARILGAKPRIVLSDGISMVDGVPHYEGKPLARPDAVVAVDVDPGSAAFQALRGWEADGVHAMNGAEAQVLGRSKVAQTAVLQEAGIPMPATSVVGDRAGVDAALGQYGFPLVLKVDDAYGGLGVWKADDAAELEAHMRDHIEPAFARGEQAIAQKFAPYAAGSTLRIDFARNADGVLEPLSADRFTARRAGEFKSNTGNTATRVPLDKVDPEALDVARRTANLSKADIVGIDVVKSPTRHEVLEWNSAPAPPEQDGIRPRREHLYPAIARWAVNGSRQRVTP